MTMWLYLAALFVAKVFDNALGTAKTILVQRNQCILAGLALGLSNFIYLSITKDIVTTDSTLALVVVSIASGVGCCLAVAFNNKFSKEKTYVNVIISDDKEEMIKLQDSLAGIRLPMTTLKQVVQSSSVWCRISGYPSAERQENQKSFVLIM